MIPWLSIRRTQLLSLFSLLLLTAFGFGQQGFPIHATLDSNGIDTINVADRSMTLTIPIVNKSGRGASTALVFTENIGFFKFFVGGVTPYEWHMLKNPNGTPQQNIIGLGPQLIGIVSPGIDFHLDYTNRSVHCAVGNTTMYENFASQDAVGTIHTYVGSADSNDALGRWVETKVGSAYTQMIYSPFGSKLAKMNGQTPVTTFVGLPGGGQAVYNGTSLSRYRHSDWQGSSRLATTPARGLYYSVAYAPFGAAYGGAGTSDPKFAGNTQDQFTSLYDTPARLDAPTQGRWLVPDPVGSGMNLYAYTGNDPVNFIDPSGLQCISIDEKGNVFCDVVDKPKPQEAAQFSPTFGPLFDIGDYFWNHAKHPPVGQRPANKVVQILRTIGNYIPVPCGAGGFAYGGPRVSGALAAVGVYGIGALDSRTGGSKGVFTDITVGEVIQGGYGYAVHTDRSTEHFLFLGAGEDAIIEKASLSAYGSHVTGDSLLRNQIGINIDVGTQGVGGGIGIGVNTDSLTSCVDHNFH